GSRTSGTTPSTGAPSAPARCGPRSRAPPKAARPDGCCGIPATTTPPRRSCPRRRRSRGLLTRSRARLVGLVVAGLAVARLAVAAELLPPNPLGRVMILEYHKIDRPEGRWTRTPESFRRDLARFWERGYRLVALNDYLDGTVVLPRGTTPLILTFDDSS